jgi:hypothetical protein
MGRPQETNLHGIFHRLLHRLAATNSLQHLLQFPDTGIASLIHRVVAIRDQLECKLTASVAIITM